ncbi:MAG: polysaccharide deacetylase [Clostridia bacterium]|nr:polysaccharide deacetylase [Clostridia bacterium]
MFHFIARCFGKAKRIIGGWIDGIRIMRSRGRTVYLTFDDGPAEYTEELLEVLKKHGVKATFFVTGGHPDYEYVIKKEKDGGHTVCAHCFCHDYFAVYSGVDAYFEDLGKLQEIIIKQTGEYTKYVRMPGGSSNTVSIKYKKGVVGDIAKRLEESGFVYYDWNVSGEDRRRRTPREVLRNVELGVLRNDPSVVLLHDPLKATPGIVDKIIRRGKKRGYRFLPLDENTPVIRHSIANI